MVRKRLFTFLSLLIVALILSGCNLAAETARQLSLSPAQQTLHELQSEERPARDLYTLASQYRPGEASDVSRSISDPPHPWQLGDKATFWVNDIQSREYYSVTAVLVVATEHSYFWMDENNPVDTDGLRKSADTFENKIYPTTRQYFGSEWIPGVDNDPHIYILNTRLQGVRGYFSSADEYRKAVNLYSNEHEMIYLDATPGNDSYAATLAHEFQHMIHWNQNRSQDVWLNEGSSELAMAVNGYPDRGIVQSLTDNADVQLNGWGETPGTSIPHYAASYLFFRYLTDHYGGFGIMKDVLSAPYRGPEAITYVLKKHGYKEDFDSVFEKWVVANYALSLSSPENKYSYQGDGLKVNIQDSVSADGQWRTGEVAQYGADYIKVDLGGKGVKLEFEGNAAVNLTAAEPHSGSHVWWSNRGDDMNTSMVREVDLTPASKATLSFWAWYDIETDYDYAYASVSEDGGKTWKTLATQHTTMANPNGTSWGNGLTGVSGGGDQPGWVEEQADLSPFAGKKIQLRFEYVTDDGFNGQGLVIDDVSIPEIGFSDDAEGDTGWDTTGFIRSTNVIPEGYKVQLVRANETIEVTNLALAANHGSIEIAPSSGDTVLVISAQAPITTQRGVYRYRLVP